MVVKTFYGTLTSIVRFQSGCLEGSSTRAQGLQDILLQLLQLPVSGESIISFVILWIHSTVLFRRAENRRTID